MAHCPSFADRSSLGLGPCLDPGSSRPNPLPAGLSPCRAAVAVAVTPRSSAWPAGIPSGAAADSRGQGGGHRELAGPVSGGGQRWGPRAAPLSHFSPSAGQNLPSIHSGLRPVTEYRRSGCKASDSRGASISPARKPSIFPKPGCQSDCPRARPPPAPFTVPEPLPLPPCVRSRRAAAVHVHVHVARPSPFTAPPRYSSPSTSTGL